jgi:hypothetical protein
MKQLLTGAFIIFLAICGITGCAPPVGSIINDGGNGGGNGGGGKEYDFLMLRPNRILYEVDGGMDGRFDRAADLRVFVAENGDYREIDPNDPDLTIEVIMNPGMMGETVTAVNTHFPFSEPGRHVIRGTYNSKTDEYSIEARGTFVNPGDGSGIIDLTWL